MRFAQIKPKVGRLNTRRSTLILSNPKATKRMTGEKLQKRRLKIWTTSPYCAKCGCLCDYPQGFELDHIISLDLGGPDTEQNCQVLCVWFDRQGNKRGCHQDKTNEETKQRAKSSARMW